MSAKYLQKAIVACRYTDPPRYGMTRMGYTARSGAPTSLMVRLDGEKRFRRLMVWQFSNQGTTFVRVKKEALIVRETDIPQCKK